MLTPVHQPVPDANQIWLWIGCGLLGLGALVIAALGRRARREDQEHFVKSFFVCVVASSAYFAMATGQLDVRVGGDDGWIAQLPRYVDWAITTPLLLLSISLVALSGPKSLAEGRQRSTLVGALIGADVLMVVTGLFATLTTDDATRWTWFAISSGFFLAVLGLLYGPVLGRGRERSGAKAGNVSLARRLTVSLSALWFLYPIVWALGPEGASWWGEAAEAAIYMVLDVLAKVGFSIVLGLGVLRLARAAPQEEGRGTIDAVSEELGSGTDRRLREQTSLGNGSHGAGTRPVAPTPAADGPGTRVGRF